jgi:plastocyanin
MKQGLVKTTLSLVLSLMAFTGRLSATDYFVDVADFFSPSTLTINVNDTVTWTNVDDFDFPHSTSSNTGLWNVTLPGYGDFYTRVFSSAGSFPYHDNGGSGTGTITVIAPNTAPSVTITNPVAGATFTAPATFNVRASATDGGSVASVQFFVDSNSIGTDTVANPYSATTPALFAGSYTLFAVATDNLGLKATNSISISVTNPIISLSGFKMTNGLFQFNIVGLVAGKTNLVEVSTNLTSWSSVRTNLASASTSSYTNVLPGPLTKQFFRVRQLP